MLNGETGIGFGGNDPRQVIMMSGSQIKLMHSTADSVESRKYLLENIEYVEYSGARRNAWLLLIEWNITLQKCMGGNHILHFKITAGTLRYPI